MNRLLIALAFLIPSAHAQVLTPAPTASPASQVLALAPQLLPFAGDANFANLVNGLALGLPVTLSTGLSNGGTQQFTFTPSGTMSALEIAQTLEKARQLLISHGVATPTAQQLGTALTGGSLSTASGTTTVNPIVAGATTGAITPSTQSPAAAIQATHSPAANAAAGAGTGVRNMSDSALPRGISDTPPQAVPGVTSPAPGSASTVTPAAAATTATPAPAAAPASAIPSAPSTSAPASIRVR